jgi:hypothetical protein
MNHLKEMRMKAWIKRALGLQDEPQIHTDLNAIDDYVVVKKKDLDALVGELQDLRNRDVKMDARELDLLVAELEHENKLLRARNERLEAEAKLQ